MSLKVLTENTAETNCVFCKKNTVNELKFGPLYCRDEVTTHYFCMIFSSALYQRGREDEGICGYLIPDILKEVKRSTRLKCIHCKNMGASINCFNEQCRKVFHYPCGLQHGTNYQFFGNFASYCDDHKTEQKITLRRRDWKCTVCMAHVSVTGKPIQANCCKAAVFHKECLQKFALSAGFAFKCPTCNASENFVHEMRSLGIYVPDQDASWEREPNAYDDLLYQYSKCDAKKCLCENGREHNDIGNWTLSRCQTCAAAGIHRKCGKLTASTENHWTCAPCLKIEKRVDAKEERKKQENARKNRSSIAS